MAGLSVRKGSVRAPPSLPFLLAVMGKDWQLNVVHKGKMFQNVPDYFNYVYRLEEK